MVEVYESTEQADVNLLLIEVQEKGLQLLNNHLFRKPIHLILPMKYFHRPILQGLHRVLPHHSLPTHILPPPEFSRSPPLFGIYQGAAVVHSVQMQSKLRRAGGLAARTLAHTARRVQAGMTTEDIDKICHDFIVQNGAYPTPIGFMGFPKSICTSVNQVLVHGIPSLLTLQSGDSLNLDVSLYLDGVHGDNSLTIRVGKVHPDIDRLITQSQKILYKAIRACKPGVPLGQIGRIIQTNAVGQGFHVCPYFTGHGVGHLLHMPPTIEHILNPNNPYANTAMQEGMVFTIEPVITLRQSHSGLKLWGDNFTVVSPDNPKAQFEHTVLITKEGAQVFTLRDDQSLTF